MLGTIPGFLVLAGALLAALFYHFQDPKTHPALGEKILREDERFERLKNEGYPVLKARPRVPEANEDMPSTRALFLYFKAKGHTPENDEYEYIALPPTRTDWLVEFFLWLVIPLIAVIYLFGERAARLALIIVFFAVLAVPAALAGMAAHYLFGSPVRELFALITGIVTVVLATTRLKDTRLFQWVF